MALHTIAHTQKHSLTYRIQCSVQSHDICAMIKQETHRAYFFGNNYFISNCYFISDDFLSGLITRVSLYFNL